MEGRIDSDITNSWDDNDHALRLLPNHQEEGENEDEEEVNSALSFDENDEGKGEGNDDDQYPFSQEEPEVKLEIDDEITVLLKEAEERNLGKVLSNNFKVMMKKMLARYAAKIERKNRMLLEKTVAAPVISLKSIVDQVANKKKNKDKEANANNDLNKANDENEEEDPSAPDFMQVMLQKKINSMQKQVELAEQKSRSSTLQW